MKLRWILALAASLVLFAGCGEEAAEEATDTTEEVAEETVEGTVEEVPEVLPLYPEGTIDPVMLTPDEPVAAYQLFEAYFAWDGALVTLVAYPFIWYGDTTIVEDELRLVGDPESTDELATAIFDLPQDVVAHRGVLIAVRGTVEMSWTGDIEITGATFVDAPEAMEDVETSPWVYDGETPIPVTRFYDMYNAWMGKEVTVEGYYHSTTTSTTDYGTTVRLDLAHPDDIYTKYVACEMTGEIPAESNSLLVDNREGVLVRGVVAGESFDMVGLEGCTLVNR